MNPVTEQAIMYGLGLINTIILGLIGIGFAYLQKYVKSNSMKNALSNLKTAVETTVGELQNNFVLDWKSANADGKLTPEEINTLKQKSLELVMDRLDEPTLVLLEAQYTDLNEYIQGMVDSYIEIIKRK